MAVPHATLSFDIGIKNLAWCICDTSGETARIQGWGNYDLLEEKEATEIVKPPCAHCKAKARFVSSEGVTCARHVPPTRPIWTDMSGNQYKKLPPFAVFRAYFIQRGILTSLPKTKRQAIETIQTVASIPLQKMTGGNAATAAAAASAKKINDLVALHDSIHRFIQQQLKPFLTQVTEIRIENQPVLKNPVMKTVQVLLFATLREVLRPYPVQPAFKLVHAGMKVKGKAAGAAGYKARKEGSEKRAAEFLARGVGADATRWRQFYEAHTKRSDLADALCMCLDATAAETASIHA